MRRVVAREGGQAKRNPGLARAGRWRFRSLTAFAAEWCAQPGAREGEKECSKGGVVIQQIGRQAILIPMKKDSLQIQDVSTLFFGLSVSRL